MISHNLHKQIIHCSSKKNHLREGPNKDVIKAEIKPKDELIVQYTKSKVNT